MVSRIRGLFGARLDYRPVDRDFLKMRGDWLIDDVTIMRIPLDSKIKTALNILSLGKFEDILKKNFDELFHLFLKIKLISPDGLKNTLEITLEKNQTIEINKYVESSSKVTDIMKLVLPETKMTLNTFLQNGLDSVGKEKYFKYDAIANNCQNFILILLQGTPKILELNPGAEKFVLQDTSSLKNELQDYVKTVISKTTDLAARADVLIHGYGLSFNLKHATF